MTRRGAGTARHREVGASPSRVVSVPASTAASSTSTATRCDPAHRGVDGESGEVSPAAVHLALPIRPPASDTVGVEDRSR